MFIRSLRPSDTAAVAALDCPGAATEITAAPWSSGQWMRLQATPARAVWRVVSHNVGNRRAWVAWRDHELVGLVAGRARRAGLAYEVDELRLVGHEEQVGIALLDRVAADARAAGARRLFLHARPTSQAQEIARRAGFEAYTSVNVYRLGSGVSLPRSDQFAARPRAPSDELPLFQLYLATVPGRVRSAEALTREEWASLYGPGRRPVILARREQQFVWELGARVVGWLRVRQGPASQHLELLVHPTYDEATEKLVRHALTLTRAGKTTYVAVREYQSGLARALEQSGFQIVEDYDSYVRMIAAPVKEPRLVPATLVGG